MLANNTSGSATGTGNVTINSLGTLGGTGIITGAVIVNGGKVAPGSSSGCGILTLGSLDLSNGGTLVIQVSAYSTPGISYDQLKLNGTLKLGGTSQLFLDLDGLSGSGNATGFVLDGITQGVFGNITTNNDGFEASMSSYGTSLTVQLVQQLP